MPILSWPEDFAANQGDNYSRASLAAGLIRMPNQAYHDNRKRPECELQLNVQLHVQMLQTSLNSLSMF